MIIHDNIILTAVIYISIVLALIFIIIFAIDRSKGADSSGIDSKNKGNGSDEAKGIAYENQAGADLPQDELIAVLTAAVTACIKPKVQSKIRVKSFRRIENHAPIWNSVGRFDRIRTKL